MASHPTALRLRTTAPRTNVWRRVFPAPPPQARPRETAVEALDTAIESWTSKALWNKKAARRGTKTIVLSSAFIPVVLLFSINIYGVQVSELLASVLAALSTAAAGFMQFNRPYADWNLYREYQRWGERERLAFQAGLKPYDSDDAAANTKLLAANLLDAKRQLEQRRTALIPDDGDVSSQARRR
jgi:hypothetical protein